MKKLIVVADWANDDLSKQEFKITVEGYLKNSELAKIDFVSSTPSTIHTAFLVSQLVETEERYGDPMQTIIFQNTDCRLKNQENDKKLGGKFIFIRLKSNIFVCGPNSQYNFSLVKEKIDEVFEYKGLKEGQFRSRDSYARVCAHLMDEMEDELEFEEISSNIIPKLTRYYVSHIDNFGNIKTTIKHEDLKGKLEYGDKLKIKINGIEKQAKYVSNLFGAQPGELIIYPGSSGYPNNYYLEISAWNYFDELNPSTGFYVFRHPLSGMKIEILV